MTIATLLQVVGILTLGGSLVLAPLWFGLFAVAVVCLGIGVLLEVRAKSKADA